MKQIKVRAWNKIDKEIQTVRCIDFCGDGSISSIRTVKAYIVSDDGDYDFDFPEYKPEDIVLQEFINLRDKNGRDIYEGDILKEEEYDEAGIDCGHIFVVEHYQDDIYNGWNAARSDVWSAEVIGNIYENPDLVRQEAERNP